MQIKEIQLLYLFICMYESSKITESLLNVRECTRQDENGTFLSSRCSLYI